MNKVLVFCSDVLPLKGMATSGGGLRSWQIIQGLQAQALDVAYSMPKDCYLSRTFREHIPPEARQRLWDHWNQEQIIETEKPDVIVLAKAALKHWEKKYDIPLAIDFHGPDVMEAEQMVKRTEPAARFMVRRNRALAKLKTISEADFFTCAGQRQRYYFMAFLLMAGVALDDAEVHYMPVAMSADLPPHEADLEHRSIIFAGGFYPWINPMPALLDLAQCLTKIDNYHLEIFGGSHETNAEEKREFDAFKAKMERNTKVTFHGTIPRDQLLAWYRKASVAFEVIPRNPERELAFTTRTVEFMWAGLPVIYNNYAELSDLIRQYQAGWLVAPGNTAELQEVVRLIAEDKDAVRLASENAQRLVRENLTYEKVITPLANFCQNPRRRERSDNCNGLIDAANAGPGVMERVYLAYKTHSRRDFAAACLRHAFSLTKRTVGKP
ncbi:MAG: glycosyltransferase family 4 protein [Thermodesulfobacteriota bacterium]|jgi:glycosyltransferase involved in cell wall biosynthesis